MKIIITILIVILFLVLEYILSTRKNYIFGIICPVGLSVGGCLFLKFIAKPGTEREWIFRFVVLIFFSIQAFFEGRKKVKEKMKKELEKMKIKDL